MHQDGPDDETIRMDCAKYDANNPDEASIILWTIWRPTRPQYSTLAACLDALTKEPGLHEVLKHVHDRRKPYDAIRNWPSRMSPDWMLAIPSHCDSIVASNVQNFLQEMEKFIVRVVDGRTSPETWSPGPELPFRDHLRRLRVPALKGKPCLLLHELGSFKNDPILQKRLNNVFMVNTHTFLVNTSGSGKTRILLEGLCDNWGFYFTSHVDASLLGSSDVQKSIQSYVPNDSTFRVHLPPFKTANYEAALGNNRAIARKVFRRVFLARLLIFSCFVEIMERYREPDSLLDEYRKRWLLLQLHPGMVHPKIWDIFDHLSNMLSAASDHYIDAQTQELLKHVRELCACESDSGSTKTPFFCVLDEAQFAATQCTTSFRSDQNGKHRPILREVVHAWEGQTLGQGVFMVVAGTGISKDVVDQAMASAIMKDSRYRWCSDTGAFDTVEVQHRYLTKYLPKSLLRSKSGKRLLERVWYWLHGRHRFTAGYVMDLIRNGFRQPHRLLNAYVRHFTDFSITDAGEFVNDEEEGSLPMFSEYKLDFSKLKKNSDMMARIHQFIVHYLMRSTTITSLGGDEAMYVEYGFARFVDSETQAVKIDEPLVLLAAIQWMNTNHQTSYKLLAQEISTHCTRFNGFENYIAFCLDLIFSGKRRLSEVFTFHGQVPPWADLEGEIVAFHRPSTQASSNVETGVASFSHSKAPSVTLGVSAQSPELVLSWLTHVNEMHSAFCFPHRSMGPDVVFILRLSDGSFIWVALQTKWTQGTNGNIAKKLLLQAMRSVTPSKYFLDKNGQPFSPAAYPKLRDDISRSLLDLPNRREDAGKYSLLRVVASFPARSRMQRYIERDPDKDHHPIATLNMQLVKRVTQKLSPHDFLQRQDVPEQRVSGLGTNLKRKKGHEIGSRRKKIKLN